MTGLQPEDAFAGFWMGGYEGADHVNGSGTALDLAQACGHLDRLEEDHRRAAQAGIRVVRESIGWRLCESAGGAIDLGRAMRIADSAERHGLQVLWTLMHYGLPADLCLHDDAMIERLARFAAEVARVLKRSSRLAPVYTPVNEIGFLAWAASQTHLFAAPNRMPGNDPESSRVSGYVVKRRLARAALAAVAAMRRVDPRARFLHVEPVVHVVAAPERPQDADHVQVVRDWQWQAWDLLSGRLEPELGGHPEVLDLVGVNHYHTSQWEFGTERRLPWHQRDPRRRPVSALLADTWQRYGRPLVIAETSHVGAGRADWLHDIAFETARARAAGVPVHGICLYPLVDRPDWGDLSRWHKSGLFHVVPPPARGGRLQRRAEPETLACMRAWSVVLPGPPLPPKPPLVAFSSRPWEGASHRTRHLMSQLARWWHVCVVEPALPTHGADPRIARLVKGPDLDVLVSHGAVTLPQLQAALADCGVGAAPTVWLDTPEAWPLAQSLNPVRVVWDRGGTASPGDGGVASDLLQHAHLVFDRTSLPDGHDPAPVVAGSWDDEEADRVFSLVVPPGRRIGYAGVVDEAFERHGHLALLAALAAARPHWQFVVVGALEIGPERLPKAPNLHWIGPMSVRLLPALLQRCDVGLVPPHLETASSLHVREMRVLGLPVVSSTVLEVCLRGCEAALRGPRPQPLRDRWTWSRVALRAHRRLQEVMPPKGDRPTAPNSAPAAVAPTTPERPTTLSDVVDADWARSTA